MRRQMDIDLRLLAILRTIVKCNGLSAALGILNMSQSSVSASLTELERRLGVRLCRRGRAGFALTQAGIAIYEASHDLFDAVDRFSNHTRSVSDRVKGLLRIGTVDAIVSNADLSLPDKIRRFRDLSKNVVVDLLTAGPEELERQLTAGHRDIVISPYNSRNGELDYLPLFTERQSLYCAKGHPLFDVPDKAIAASDLAAHAFIARQYLHRFDLVRIGHLEAEAIVDTMESQLMLILSGKYFGYLPSPYAQAWVRSGDLRAIKERPLSYDSTFFAMTAKRSAENRLVRRFLDLLSQAGAPPNPLKKHGAVSS